MKKYEGPQTIVLLDNDWLGRTFATNRQRVRLQGIIGMEAIFHSYRTNTMARKPPMVKVEITKVESQAYVTPPPESGICETSINIEYRSWADVSAWSESYHD